MKEITVGSTITMMKKIGIKLTVLSVFVLISASSFAQNFGKISGLILDEGNGDALIGASIVIIGTSLGAATDLDGNYNILSVPPGTYTIKISFIGYNPKMVQNVKVASSLTTRIDAKLSEQTLSLSEEITVTAERPMVTKDLTASTAIISGDQIAALPVTEVSQIVSLQAGNVNGHFRGGRSSEVSYMIDGVPVTDKFDGSQVTEVNKNMVSELQVISGAFNAEYGQAMSAIVNVSTKDGENQFNGSATTYFGDYITGHDDIFIKPSTYNPLAIQNYEATFSGPILRDNLYFFAVARWVDFGGHLYGQRKFNTDNVFRIDTVDHNSSLGDNKIVPMNNSSKLTLQNKFTWPITTGMKASLNMIYEKRKWKEYDRFRVFVPDAVATQYQNSLTGILSLTHTLTANTFYTASISGFGKEYSKYVYDGLDSRYVQSSLSSSAAGDLTLSTGGVDMNQFNRTINSFSLKSDLLSQINNSHQIKAGFEFKIHNLTFQNRQVTETENSESLHPYIIPKYNNENTVKNYSYGRNPKDFSAYIQDKMEFNNFILNVGLRFDWFDAAGYVPNDLTDPNIFSPIKFINNYFDLNGDGKIENIDYNKDGTDDLVEFKLSDESFNQKSLKDREAYWWKKSTYKYQFSPRIGAAFPITDKAKIYFSYGMFYQFPNFDILYRNAYYMFESTTGANSGVAGNSDLRPEKNTSVELGLQQQIGDNLSVDATVYFRDYRDLSGSRANEIEMLGGRTYSQLVNSDFGIVRGFILSFNQRMNDGWGVTVDYTFQTAKGTASDPEAANKAIQGGSQPEVILKSLDWDQTHTLNTTFNYNAKNWGFSTIISYGSGLPYTPQTGSIAAVLTNDEVKPPSFNTDLRAFYNYDLSYGSVSFFARVYNLFDTLNEFGVFDDTGRTATTLKAYKDKDKNTYGINTIKEKYTNPQNYSEPRRIEFGLSYNF